MEAEDVANYLAHAQMAEKPGLPEPKLKQEKPNTVSPGGTAETRPGSLRARFQWRALASVVTLLSFAVLASSGLVLWLAPPGRIANWTDWNILGLRKAAWIDLHIWFALVFLLAAFFHVAFNWCLLLGYFKKRPLCRWGFRWEWCVAAALCAVVFAGVRLGLAPFSSLLTYTDALRESWADSYGAGRRGRAASAVESPTTISTDRQSGRGFGGGGGRGGGGGGYGRQTLKEVCAEAGLETSVAQDRLKARGIRATPSQTLREIAEASGIARPSELLEIIRTGASNRPEVLSDGIGPQ